jgi:pimeloyl-ACP methyl ester carboxylesterase
MVDVGGYQLYIHCTGKGPPTVIMEAGYGDVGETWSLVQPKVAGLTRACSYDRAGLGLSDPGPEPRHSLQIVDELHTLLANAGIEGPFVLVGHSMGGLYMRLYAGRYRQDVVGLVLVDSAHPDQVRRQAAVLPPESPDDSESLRFYRDWFTNAPDDPTLNPELFEAGSLGDMPLVVLTAPNKERADDFPAELNARFNQIWVELQEELVQLSSNSTHVISEKSQHFIQRDQPELVIDAIRQVVSAAPIPPPSPSSRTPSRVPAAVSAEECIP